jgi:hypothetical protein
MIVKEYKLLLEIAVASSYVIYYQPVDRGQNRGRIKDERPTSNIEHRTLNKDKGKDKGVSP